MVDRHTVFEVWSPDGAAWARWVKPVLFAALPRDLPPVPDVRMLTINELAGVSATAIVVELPGPYAVDWGVQLARQGWRPIPLFVGSPAPIPESGEPREAVVDVESILGRLVEATDTLKRLNLPPKAPPAFLVDSERGAAPHLSAGMWDNRSLHFEADFPSAVFLKEHGITSVIRIATGDPPLDLARVLRKWHDGGIELLSLSPMADAKLSPLRLPRHLWLYDWLTRLRADTAYRNAMGGFGFVSS